MGPALGPRPGHMSTSPWSDPHPLPQRLSAGELLGAASGRNHPSLCQAGGRTPLQTAAPHGSLPPLAEDPPSRLEPSAPRPEQSPTARPWCCPSPPRPQRHPAAAQLTGGPGEAAQGGRVRPPSAAFWGPHKKRRWEKSWPDANAPIGRRRRSVPAWLPPREPPRHHWVLLSGSREVSEQTGPR